MNTSLDWQLLIIGTIVMARLLGSYIRVPGIMSDILAKFNDDHWLMIIVCIGWAVWTVSKLNGGLQFIQLGFILVTAAIIFSFDQWRKKVKIAIIEAEEAKKKLKKAKRELKQLKSKVIQNTKSKEVKKIIENTPLDPARDLLRNKDHRKFFTQSIDEANKQVIIFSGWITSHVVDINLIGLLEKAMRRGVSVFIGFGYETGGEHRTIGRGDRALRKLTDLADKYPGRMYIGKFKTHEKILIRDTDITVYGSFNWLTNRKVENAESSIVLRDSGLAELESDRTIKDVKSNPIQDSDKPDS